MELWLLITLVAFHVLGILSVVALVGKPRQPITPGAATVSVIIGLMIISALIIWGNA